MKKKLLVVFAILSMCLCCCSKTESVVGPQGEQGVPGEQGQPGQDGADGTSLLTGHGVPSSNVGKLGDSYIDLDTWDYYTKTSNGWVKQGNIKGSDGKDGEDGADGITYIPAIFNNYDGTMLYTFYYEKGSTITYNGPTPTRPSDWNGDEELPYTFKGWDKSLENIQEPTIFTAQYRSKMYNVTFKNYDGSTLFATQVERGHDAIYEGATPVRDDNPNLEWTFTGWDKPLTNIIKDTAFIAQFYAPNSIQCIFKNYDGTILSTQYVGNGDTVVYEGETPTRPDENDEGTITKYDFIGWDKSLKNIDSDTTFIAQFGPNIYYEVSFVNYDGELLYKTHVFQGGQAIYEGETPTKPQNVEGNTITDYTFTGWDSSLICISSPTILTAQYSSNSYIGYKVTFLDSDMTELYSYYCKENNNAVYPYEELFTYDSSTVYIFKSWDKSLNNITAKTTFIAQYLSIPRDKNGEYPKDVILDQTLVNKLNSLTETNSNGYYELNGEQYAKIIATPRQNVYPAYTFNDGTYISNGATYYFKVEPIQWKYLSQNGDTVFLVSKYGLDAHNYSGGEPNYKNSSIRQWLNDYFINKAFLDDSLIDVTAVDNSVASTAQESNPYACETTYDKIFLLSASDLLNEDYGFSTSASYNDSKRTCTPTDYSMARGSERAWAWTRSPTKSNGVVVCSGGKLLMGTNYNDNLPYGLYYSNVTIRPALNFKII